MRTRDEDLVNVCGCRYCVFACLSSHAFFMFFPLCVCSGCSACCVAVVSVLVCVCFVFSCISVCTVVSVLSSVFGVSLAPVLLSVVVSCHVVGSVFVLSKICWLVVLEVVFRRFSFFCAMSLDLS